MNNYLFDRTVTVKCKIDTILQYYRANYGRDHTFSLQPRTCVTRLRGRCAIVSRELHPTYDVTRSCEAAYSYFTMSV